MAQLMQFVAHQSEQPVDGIECGTSLLDEHTVSMIERHNDPQMDQPTPYDRPQAGAGRADRGPRT